jgi:hypothetical protein
MPGAGEWFALFVYFFAIYLLIGVFRTANSNYKSMKMLHKALTYEFAHDTFTVICESFRSTETKQIYPQWVTTCALYEMK